MATAQSNFVCVEAASLRECVLLHGSAKHCDFGDDPRGKIAGDHRYFTAPFAVLHVVCALMEVFFNHRGSLRIRGDFIPTD